jgi:hypothetical protein
MKCPYCDGAMQVGKASVAKSTLGEVADVLNVLRGGLSSQSHYVYFRAAETREAIYVDHSRTAFYCPSCQALVLGPAGPGKDKGLRRASPGAAAQTPYPTLCPACGGPIALGDQRCPSCDIALG